MKSFLLLPVANKYGQIREHAIQGKLWKSWEHINCIREGLIESLKACVLCYVRCSVLHTHVVHKKLCDTLVSIVTFKLT